MIEKTSPCLSSKEEYKAGLLMKIKCSSSKIIILEKGITLGLSMCVLG